MLRSLTNAYVILILELVPKGFANPSWYFIYDIMKYIPCASKRITDNILIEQSKCTSERIRNISHDAHKGAALPKRVVKPCFIYVYGF